jgi:hypothetical protein
LIGSIVEMVLEAHDLPRSEAAKLRRVATGTVEGNRDLPLFLLAVSILKTESDDLLLMVLPGNSLLSRWNAALLDFVFSASLEIEAQTVFLMDAVVRAKTTSDPAKQLTANFAAVLHAWRRQNVPEASFHNVFTVVRRFLTQYRPEDPLPRDGDALVFWEAEGTRELLTRYVSALRALADYAEAARLAATWRNTGSLDDPMAAYVSSDEAMRLGQNDPLDPNGLQDALSLVAQAPIKLLLAKERDSLTTLAGFADVVRIWPCSTLVALALGPIQNDITQAIRRGEFVLSSEKFFAKTRCLEDIVQHHAILSEALLAVLHFIARSKGFSRKTDPVRSKSSMTLNKKIAAMERRQSYADFQVNERSEMLDMLVEPALSLKVMMEAYLKAWKKLEHTCDEAVIREHRIVFQRKLDALYGIAVRRPMT